jgi:hypothetical protein
MWQTERESSQGAMGVAGGHPDLGALRRPPDEARNATGAGLRPRLWIGVALAGLVTAGGPSLAMAQPSAAATVHHGKAPHRRAARGAISSATYEQALGAVAALSDKVRTLESEVDVLKGRLDDQASAQARTNAVVEQQAQAQQAAQAQAAQAAATIQTIPAQVASAVDAAKPKTDAFYYKGLRITPSGFLEAANQYRSRALGSDMFSPFNAIPFDSFPAAHESEDRFSARQSRTAKSTSWAPPNRPIQTSRTPSRQGCANSLRPPTGTPRAGICSPGRPGRWRR